MFFFIYKIKKKHCNIFKRKVKTSQAIMWLRTPKYHSKNTFLAAYKNVFVQNQSRQALDKYVFRLCLFSRFCRGRFREKKTFVRYLNTYLLLCVI